MNRSLRFQQQAKLSVSNYWDLKLGVSNSTNIQDLVSFPMSSRLKMSCNDSIFNRLASEMEEL
jgi:ribosome-associated toxin RatA of RatAB toxin-antitoxin module